jgi:hypothetical protein
MRPMEVLNMTFAGVTVQTWIWIAIAAWVIHRVINAVREHRQTKRQLDHARKDFEARHRWQPRMINGVDCGEWVEK